MALVAMLAAGCSTALSVGGQGIATTRSDYSAEATVAGGSGLVGVNARLEGSIGAATRGGLQGRILGGPDVAWFGEDCADRQGWQGRLMGGGSFGAYQSSDALFEVATGLHWNLECKMDGSGTMRVASLMLDVIAGFAVRDGHADGALFGLALSYRFDKHETTHFNR
jgi:hypothetical protein